MGEDDEEDAQVMSSNVCHSRAALEARLMDLKEVAQEKEAASLASSAAAAAAQKELQDLRSRHESARIASQPLEKIIRDELHIIDTWLTAHQDKETTITAEAGERKARWAKEKEVLAADLHRAQLQAVVAEEGVNVASELAKTLRTPR